MKTADHYQSFHYVLPVVFVYIRYIWATLALGPEALGSVKVRLPFMVTSWISYYLATPTVSEPPLPLHILDLKIVSRRFCGWGCIPIPPLEMLPSYRRWLFQAHHC